MFSDNIHLHSAEAKTNQKANFFSRERSCTYFDHSWRKQSNIFLYLLSDANCSLNLDITFQTRKFRADHSLNSGCSFQFFISNLMIATWWINFPPNLLVIRFFKSLFDFDVPHTPFVKKKRKKGKEKKEKKKKRKKKRTTYWIEQIAE